MYLAEDDSDIGKEFGFTADGRASQHCHTQVSSINATRKFQSRQTSDANTTMHISYRHLGSDKHINELQV